MKNCKTCAYFKRGKWHKCIDREESEQLGGTCEMLARIIGMTNWCVRTTDSLHVQESFGCLAHTEAT